MKNFWYYHAEKVLMVALFSAVVVVLVLAIVGISSENAEWEQFRQTHDCKITGRMSGDLITGFTSNGSVATAATPDKTAWTCNDGVTYWR